MKTKIKVPTSDAIESKPTDHTIEMKNDDLSSSTSQGNENLDFKLDNEPVHEEVHSDNDDIQDVILIDVEIDPLWDYHSTRDT